MVIVSSPGNRAIVQSSGRRHTCCGSTLGWTGPSLVDGIIAPRSLQKQTFALCFLVMTLINTVLIISVHTMMWFGTFPTMVVFSSISGKVWSSGIF